MLAMVQSHQCRNTRKALEEYQHHWIQCIYKASLKTVPSRESNLHDDENSFYQDMYRVVPHPCSCAVSTHGSLRILQEGRPYLCRNTSSKLHPLQEQKIICTRPSFIITRPFVYSTLTVNSTSIIRNSH